MNYDYCVVGGGIVGMAAAMKLLERSPGAGVLLLEKEQQIGRHQTSHNSGVVHAGVYYEPGSLKAELCRRGAAATEEFCREHGVRYDVPGKLVVATTARELQRLDALLERSLRNDLQVRRLSSGELREWEPDIAGLGALHYPTTGITDYGAVCAAMARVVRSGGGQIRTDTAVTGIAEHATEVTVTGGGQTWRCSRLVVCGGLQADRLARLAGLRPNFRIVPFRGEYYQLPSSRSGNVKRLIYPVPDPALPFLGVHLTPTIEGGVTVGPNAVLGLSREGYPRGSVDRGDLLDLARFPGTWRVARRHWRTGLAEVRLSASKRAYLRACRTYCPSLELEDLLPHEAGIRAQAVQREGTLVHDFVLLQTERMLHVGNAPSPAATSALPIGELIAQRSTPTARRTWPVR